MPTSSSSPGAIEVTLAGVTPTQPVRRPERSAESTLDDALSKLATVTAPVNPSQPKSFQARSTAATEMRPLLRMLQSVSAAASRRHAVEQIAKQCQRRFEGTVQVAIGTDHMSRLFDGRRGWLAADSKVFRDREADWRQQFSGDWDHNRSPLVERKPRAIDLCLPQPDDAGECFIWIESDSLTEDSFAWLSDAAVATIAAVLWSRPTISWPALLIRAVRRSYMTLIVAASVFALLLVWPVAYRIPCTAVVETTKQRLISAPFEATLSEAYVEPGDEVKAGERLFSLDGRPLRLELEAVEAELQQTEKEEHVARANGRIAEAQQSALKKQQLQRRSELLTDRLVRLDVASPIDGVVVSGDLDKLVGSPLDKGQTLIEVAPMDRVVIEIEIPEYEIGYVEAEAATRIRIDAIGGPSIHAKLDSVRPAAEVRDDRNVFVGRVELDNRQQFKPGMQGEATTYGPLRPWVWSWVRGAWEKSLWWFGY